MHRPPTGRLGAGLLHNLQLNDFVTSTPDEYVDTAARLAADIDQRINLRLSLRPRMQASPLMSAPEFTHDVEALYRRLWIDWCQKRSSVNRGTQP